MVALLTMRILYISTFLNNLFDLDQVTTPNCITQASV